MANPKAKKAYSLFKKNNRPNFYVRFRNRETGDFNATGHSTGTADREQAERIAMEWLVNGIPGKDSVQTKSIIDIVRKSSLTKKDVETICREFKRQGFIKSYVMTGSRQEIKAKDYFKDYYSVDGRIRIDRPITKGYSYDRLKIVGKYWDPFLGERYISEFTTEDMKQFKFNLQEIQNLSELYKKQVFTTGLEVFKQARYDGLIDEDITSGVRNFKGKAKEKNILTPEQAEMLFYSEWKSNKIKLGNYLAYRTGFRVGEVIGLQKEDLRCIDGKYFIQLRHSFSSEDGLKSTKTNTDELIPIADKSLMDMLLYLANTNPYKNGYVFWSDKSTRKDKPICAKQMLSGLKEQLQECGFADSSKKITFHSWRHFNRTYMQVVGNCSSRTLSRVTGHSVEMIDNLYSNHFTEEDYKEYIRADSQVYKGTALNYFNSMQIENVQNAIEYKQVI